MKVLLISPYHGGSHRAWAEGYQKYSTHDLLLLTLPARYWKWRMHGGAVTLARQFEASDFEPDVMVATDMLDVSTFLSLTRETTAGLPIVLYMHENQLTYPLPEDPESGPMRRQHGERDLHYAFINYASMLSADRVVFNSQFHRRSFFDALPGFLNHFPEFREEQTVGQVKERSFVLPVGLDLEELKSASHTLERELPLILWNQRWEYDKNPEAFFRVMLTLARQGIPFELAVCGESFQQPPEIFDQAAQRLNRQVIHWGYAEQDLYRKLLWDATLTVSTALHEFFGISILEAAFCQTLPLVPKRLSYPEILPSNFHPSCLYESEDELLEQLKRALADPQSTRETAQALATQVGTYDWKKWAPEYDRLLEEISPIR
jgi:glycosyltransferase involved in cell wall biosynthesis